MGRFILSIDIGSEQQHKIVTHSSYKSTDGVSDAAYWFDALWLRNVSISRF
jgi:hypothetical protein